MTCFLVQKAKESDLVAARKTQDGYGKKSSSNCMNVSTYKTYILFKLQNVFKKNTWYLVLDVGAVVIV